MTFRKIFIPLFFIITSVCFGQNQSLNTLDSNGKKHGKWIRYLDKQWKPVSDSTKAVFYRYTFYDHGINIHPMGRGGKNNWKMESLPDINLQSEKIKILDGEYKWYDTKNRLLFVHVLKNGVYVSYKEYFKTGELQTYFDYTKNWEGQPYSWYLYTYDKTGKIIYEGYTKKDKDGHWPKMRG